MAKLSTPKQLKLSKLFKRAGLYVLCILILFASVGVITSLSSTYRLSTNTLTNWTNEIENSFFLHLLGMESRILLRANPHEELPSLPSAFLQVTASIKPNDPRSLLGNELPGFSLFNQSRFYDGDSHHTPAEFSPPLEDVLREREAVVSEELEEDNNPPESDTNQHSTGNKEVVFIYNTHNYESFLPHLPEEDNPDLALHHEVNISKVSNHLANALKAKGIGTMIDQTDHMSVLDEKGMEYWQSYDASRMIVQEAVASNQHIQYVFDLHRDGISRDKTTTVIDGEPYGKIKFVIGSEYASNDKNMELAMELKEIMDEKYPGLSRDITPQGGPGNNGVYNQDLHENALLIEIGGVHNRLEELYRSADALAEVFSEYYWGNAEKVSGN